MMRTNGWTCPWHPLQVAVWLFVLFTALGHFGFLVYYFPGQWRLLGYIVPGLGLVTLMFLVVMTTTINPADPHLRRKLIIGLFKRGKFDRSKHEHVIEDFHCHLCDTDVAFKTKHCKICDKCVEGFDHHCKWLNTCIGSRNYRWFISTLFTSLFGVVCAALMSTIFFILFFSYKDGIRHFCDDVYNTSSCDSSIKIFGATVPDPVFPVVTGFIGILYAIAVVLIGHLTLFHCYLIWKGLSTYDYILIQREAASTEDSGGLSCFKKKVNRVSPDQELDRESSTGSVGMATFNRTPPESENERETAEPHESIDNSDTVIVAEATLKPSPESDHEESYHSPVNSFRVEPLSFSNQDDLCNVNVFAKPQDSLSVQLSCDEELIMLPVEHSPSPEPYPDTIENCEDNNRFKFSSSLPPIDGGPVSLIKPSVDSNRHPLLPLERIMSDSSNDRLISSSPDSVVQDVINDYRL